MATTKGIEMKKNTIAPAGASHTLKGLLSSENIKRRFDDILGKKSAGFISSLLSVANNNKLLMKADPNTVIAAGAMAAALDLPVNPSLGFAYIIPYGNQAQFQLGYKGMIQLAKRSGVYKHLNAGVVYEGQLKTKNYLTGEIELGEPTSDKVVGYFAYLEEVNGFNKTVYMSIDEMISHAKKYSKNYKGGTEKWGITDFDSMATKTVLKRLLSKWGTLSIEMVGGEAMAMAMSNDGAVLNYDQDGEIVADFDGETIDTEAAFNDVDTVVSEGGDLIDIETGEIVETPIFAD